MLLASDLGKMIHLEQAKVKLAQLYSPYKTAGTPWWDPEQILQTEAEEILGRFVPWEGYPHKVVGKRGVIYFQK